MPDIPLHRSAGQSAAARRTNKLLAKSNWFRKTSDDPTEGEESQGGVADRKGVVAGGKARQNAQESNEKAKAVRTKTVMLVEFSKGGMLLKKMRETLDRVTPMMGLKVRVAEQGGTSLGSLLSNKNLWSGQECGRVVCRTCARPEERKEPCTVRNVVYESE